MCSSLPILTISSTASHYTMSTTPDQILPLEPPSSFLNVSSPQSLLEIRKSSFVATQTPQSILENSITLPVASQTPQPMLENSVSLPVASTPQSILGNPKTSSTATQSPQSLLEKATSFVNSLFTGKNQPKRPPISISLSLNKHRAVHDLALKLGDESETAQCAVEAKYRCDNGATYIDLRLSPQCPGKGRFTQIILFVALRDQGTQLDGDSMYRALICFRRRYIYRYRLCTPIG